MAAPQQQKPVVLKGFTVTHSTIVREIRTKVRICQPFNPKDAFAVAAAGNSPEFVGIWDTGATGSCITKKVIAALGLAPIGKQLCIHAQGSELADQFVIGLMLPNQVAFPLLTAVEAKLYDPDDATRNKALDIDVLIGMDVISQGDFLICNAGGVTNFEFRVPSAAVNLRVPTGNQPSSPAKVGRNEPCPCGSGKKYKACHGASS